MENYLKNYYSFEELMPYRVKNILLVASMYDSFLFAADDESLNEALLSQMLDPYHKSETKIIMAKNPEETFENLKNKSFDLIITMIQVGEFNMDDFVSGIRKISSDIPVLLLSFNMQDICNMSNYIKSFVDGVFLWQGDTRIFSAMINMIEDKKNAESDLQKGVQAVLLVEDNIKFYSSYLPLIYSELMKQTQIVMADELNPLKKNLRLKARPKIFLSKTYEEAWNIYSKYKQNLLGVITDVEYPREGNSQSEAGIYFAKQIKNEIPDMPVLLQSSNDNYQRVAGEIGCSFLNKNSPDISRQLRGFIQRYFGFGDFIFTDEFGYEIARATDLNSMLNTLKSVPAKSIIYHASRNHFSKWLFARTEFEIAYHLRPKKISEFKDGEEIRKYLIETIYQFIYRNQLGSVLKFDRRLYDSSSPLVKIGTGSIGGKARGLAFIDFLLSKDIIPENIDGIKITTPNSVVLATDIFDFFIEQNNLESIINENYDDEVIAEKFSQIDLPDYAIKDLLVILEKMYGPIAVRSSSILEDSKTYPFAGIYKTYMLRNNDKDLMIRFKELQKAIKYIYASVFSKEAKAFRKMTIHMPDEEKMAVIIQRLVGRNYIDSYYYPLISGVLHSYNYYPVMPLKSDNPIAYICAGIGEWVVSGLGGLRYSPDFPENLHQFSTIEDMLTNSQKQVLCLDLKNTDNKEMRYNYEPAIMEVEIDKIEKSQGFEFLASTYNIEEDRVYDGISTNGQKLITFAPIIKNEIIPFNKILRELSKICTDAMGSNIEMEFALDYIPEEKRFEFNILQIRPMVSKSAYRRVELLENTEGKILFINSNSSLGNGYINDIKDIVYINPETFSNLKTMEIVDEINLINEKLKKENSHYILIGPGRWGTSDIHLGIPVKWNNISSSKVIVEAEYGDFRVDPSYGTHFFHNVVSLGIGYITISANNDYINWDWLSRQKIKSKTKYVIHIELDKNLDIRIDGHSNKAKIFYPL